MERSKKYFGNLVKLISHYLHQTIGIGRFLSYLYGLCGRCLYVPLYKNNYNSASFYVSYPARKMNKKTTLEHTRR